MSVGLTASSEGAEAFEGGEGLAGVEGLDDAPSWVAVFAAAAIFAPSAGS